MSTRPLPPPAILRDDPGPWSVVSSIFAQTGRPGRRRPQPPMGLMLSPPPDVGLELAGVVAGSAVAGVGSLEVIAAAREPALSLGFDAAAGLLRGVSPHVLRAWALPELRQVEEVRPGDDPSAALAPPVHAAALADGELPGSVAAPGDDVVAVPAREGRFDVVVLLREHDRAVVRWIRGARTAAWSDDGALLALGGPWGVLLTRGRPTRPSPGTA
jgi:hypothetical protein